MKLNEDRAVSAGMTQGVSVPAGVTYEAQGQPYTKTNTGVGGGSKKPMSGLLHNPSGRRAQAAVPLLSLVEKRGVAARLPILDATTPASPAEEAR